MPVYRVHPEHFLGRLDSGDVQVHHDRLIVAAHQHALQRLIGAGIDFLVWHIGRDVNAVARPGFRDKLQLRPSASGRAP